MTLQRLSAFSDGSLGGNPAGVVIADQLPSRQQMQSIAADVGYSETVFAAREADRIWTVRYFSPESEVPFCGHATIALGAALAERFGAGTHTLNLSEASITVEGSGDDGLMSAALQSPPTWNKPVDKPVRTEVLALFGFAAHDLDERYPVARIHAGADHLLLPLKDRATLAAMTYDLDAGRTFMNTHQFVTVMLVWAQDDRLFHVRNAFASGGVLEDPATGAAAAAFAGYLRDNGLLAAGDVDVVQGEDMGSRSRLKAQFSQEPGSSVRVSGTVRPIT
ncbi:PhzF family phenazine biosynthesis protein [Ahrensia marina]|uniref:PhzF family phenazine biosynthesis protein n=1 Tax=Ahrensia marina TaxID=1514904 RepID=UPI0035D0389B